MAATVHELHTAAKPVAEVWSVDAEQTVIGKLMVSDADVLEAVRPILRPEMFHARSHQIIYRAIIALSASGQPYDIVSLAEWLQRQKLRRSGGDVLETVGGMQYLGELVQSSPPGMGNIVHYARIVRDYHTKRKVLELSEKARGAIYYPGEYQDTASAIAALQRDLSVLQDDLLSDTNSADFVDMRAMLSAAIDLVDKRFNSGSLITGVPTGWARFDEMTSGLQPGDLIIVAARPSMGKTAFALNAAISVASARALPVLFFSLEMPSEQLTLRAISSSGRIDSNRLRTGKLEDDDWSRMTSAVSMLGDAQFFVNDASNIGISDVTAHARKMAKSHGRLGCIVVDYIGLMRTEPRKDGRHDLAIGEISRGLKLLAKELGVPVIALSQLNRGVEQRRDKRPMMSDLRESGALEQDADLIIFLYRDEVYNADSVDKGCAEIIIAKQRNGETGTLPMAFLGQYQRFEELFGALPSVSSGGDARAKEYHSNDF